MADYEDELLDYEEDHEQVGAGQHRLWQGQAAWLCGAARSKLEAPALAGALASGQPVLSSVLSLLLLLSVWCSG